MSGAWHVHLAGWQKIAWALDEDLSWVRRGLGKTCHWQSLPFARIVHAAWPYALDALPAASLRGKIVLCQADNPPAFYQASGHLSHLAAKVDLWIARSTEALSQFRALGLSARMVPYAVDPNIFRPLGRRDKIRESLGIPPDAFVVGNFHRDSEGSDLTRPKKQKGPDLFLEIVRLLHAQIPRTVVLLAGPRRHWLLKSLRACAVPVFFAGSEPGDADDYETNVLPRENLNRLYQALDVCLISSRWEGGPYSVLEALAAGTTVVSSPVGTSRDVLPGSCIFKSTSEACRLLVEQARSRKLDDICREASRRAALTHDPDALRDALFEIYGELPTGAASPKDSVACAFHLMRSRLGFGEHGKVRQNTGKEQQLVPWQSSSSAGAGFIDYATGGGSEEVRRVALAIDAARNSP